MATALQDLYGTGSEQFDQIILPEGYQPSEDEEFMCVEQRAYFLQKLKDWKESPPALYLLCIGARMDKFVIKINASKVSSNERPCLSTFLGVQF